MNRPATVDTSGAIHPYRVTAADYLRMIGAGGFDGTHVELVEGELIEMAPSGVEHGKANVDIAVDLSVIYRSLGYLLVVDAVVELSDTTVRAPDISVIDKAIGDRQVLLPDDILLAVEIARATLTEDLGRKRIDYASSGIRHYWVVDLVGRRVHCYADPQGSDYTAIRAIPFGQPVPVPGTAESVTIE